MFQFSGQLHKILEFSYNSKNCIARNKTQFCTRSIMNLMTNMIRQTHHTSYPLLNMNTGSIVNNITLSLILIASFLWVGICIQITLMEIYCIQKNVRLVGRVIFVKICFWIIHILNNLNNNKFFIDKLSWLSTKRVFGSKKAFLSV